jgi:hypothetical protein
VVLVTPHRESIMSLKPDALCYLSAVDLAARIRARKVSPVEVIDTLTARIKRLNLGRYKWLTAAAARFYAEAFAAEPKRAEDPASANRSGAARAAALAGAGQGEDAGSLRGERRCRPGCGSGSATRREAQPGVPVNWRGWFSVARRAGPQR